MGMRLTIKQWNGYERTTRLPQDRAEAFVRRAKAFIASGRDCMQAETSTGIVETCH